MIFEFALSQNVLNAIAYRRFYVFAVYHRYLDFVYVSNGNKSTRLIRLYTGLAG